jgi:hypothetical protein
MESADFIPGKAFDAGKSIQRLHLRNSRGKDDTEVSAGFGQFPEGVRGRPGGGGTGSLAVGMNLHIHASYLKSLHLIDFHDGLKLPSILTPAPENRAPGAGTETGKPEWPAR